MLRLVGGTNIYSGRLEINILGEWGTVCGGLSVVFSDNEAKVACRQMGLPYREAVAARRGIYFDPADTRPAVYHNVVCNGDEERIDFCDHLEYVTCSHYYDVGIICSDTR